MCLKSYLLMDSAAFELECYARSPFPQMYNMHMTDLKPQAADPLPPSSTCSEDR
jgi:hypothetical protein